MSDHSERRRGCTYIARLPLPDGRIAGVKRSDGGWTLECGDLRRLYACVLDALEALGTWAGRVRVVEVGR